MSDIYKSMHLRERGLLTACKRIAREWKLCSLVLAAYAAYHLEPKEGTVAPARVPQRSAKPPISAPSPTPLPPLPVSEQRAPAPPPTRQASLSGYDALPGFRKFADVPARELRARDSLDLVVHPFHAQFYQQEVRYGDLEGIPQEALTQVLEERALSRLEQACVAPLREREASLAYALAELWTSALVSDVRTLEKPLIVVTRFVPGSRDETYARFLAGLREGKETWYIESDDGAFPQDAQRAMLSLSGAASVRVSGAFYDQCVSRAAMSVLRNNPQQPLRFRIDRIAIGLGGLYTPASPHLSCERLDEMGTREILAASAGIYPAWRERDEARYVLSLKSSGSVPSDVRFVWGATQ